MRLFIAINFNDEIKDALCDASAELMAAAKRGRTPRRENLHLTLVFIGETTRVDDILDVMEEAADKRGRFICLDKEIAQKKEVIGRESE